MANGATLGKNEYLIAAITVKTGVYGASRFNYGDTQTQKETRKPTQSFRFVGVHPGATR